MKYYRKLIRADIRNVLKEQREKERKGEAGVIQFGFRDSQEENKFILTTATFRLEKIHPSLLKQVHNFINQYFISRGFGGYKPTSSYRLPMSSQSDVREFINTSIEEAVRKSAPEYDLDTREIDKGRRKYINYYFIDPVQ